jgi:O-antigen ligase
MESSPETVVDDNAYTPAGSGLAFAVGFFLSFRIIIVVFSVRVLDIDPQTGTEIRLALNFLLLGFVCFALLGTANRTLGSVLRLPSIRWVLIFLSFSGCSLLWSETASPLASAAYWCGTATDVAIVVLLLLRGSVPGVAGSLMKGFVWSACLVAIIAWLMPAQYDLRLGDEEFFNANTIGNLCVFAIFFTQYLTHHKEGNWWLATVFLAITLLRSLSKTTIVAFVLSESFLVIQDRQMGRRTKIFLTTAVMLVVLIFWGLFEAYYDFYTTYGNQAETLTGRTAIWAYVLEGAIQQPWIGHGFDSIWKVVPTFGTFEARHAENEVLEQFYSYGVAGIVMLSGVYGSLYRRIRRLPRGSLQVIFASIVLFIVVRGLAEAEPFDLLLPLWAVVLMSMVVAYADPIDQETTVVSPSVRPLQPTSVDSSHAIATLSKEHITDQLSNTIPSAG